MRFDVPRKEFIMTKVRGCGSPEHVLGRRAMMGAMGASMFSGMALANPLVKQNKVEILMYRYKV